MLSAVGYMMGGMCSGDPNHTIAEPLSHIMQLYTSKSWPAWEFVSLVASNTLVIVIFAHLCSRLPLTYSVSEKQELVKACQPQSISKASNSLEIRGPGRGFVSAVRSQSKLLYVILHRN